ncbi:MAG: hypothetical protein JWP22_2411 [Ramlibacter sp.]|nr:hypothetical protein [Ramlibacter sp.]
MTTDVDTANPSQPKKPHFTWGIRSTDISFMRTAEAEAALDGCNCNCDCGAISKFDKPRKKRAAQDASN